MRFVDTNILIYAAGLHPEEPRKRDLARAILRERDICLSVQVLNEFFDRAVRTKRPVSLTDHEARSFLATLRPLPITSLTRELHDHALEIRAQTAYGIYDCLILAAALAMGCNTLLSEDMQHGRLIESLTIMDPFRAA